MSAATGFDSCFASSSALAPPAGASCATASGGPSTAAVNIKKAARGSTATGASRVLHEHLCNHAADRRARVLHHLVCQTRLGDALPDDLLLRQVDDVHVRGAGLVTDGLDLGREGGGAVETAPIAVVAI